MFRYLFMVVSVSISALGAVAFLNDNPEFVQTASTIVEDRLEIRRAKRSVAVAKEEKPRRMLSGTERLRADQRGHYVADFKLNSSRVTGVIDTGATTIAISRSVARRAGIHVQPGEFIYKVNTANGTTRAARAIIDEVRLGTIRVRKVEALILEDDSLNIVLIGMSFLNRLRNFEFANGVLVMKL